MQRIPRWALATLCAGVGLLACATSAPAQAPEPVPSIPGDPVSAPQSTDPSLLIETADLRQSGEDLVLELHFSRDVPVSEIDPSKGRFICLVLAPAAASRRRLCISHGAGGLRTSLTAIDAQGRASGPALALGRAHVSVDDDELDLQVPAESVHVKLGADVPWQALVTWHDTGPCTQAAVARTCTQVVPASGTRTLHTRAPAAPAFVRDGRLRLLATGDSMIQIVDSYLAARLADRRGASVRSDARISTGLSKPSMLDWVAKAREQARSLHPDVTAVFLGANDGFAMKTPRGASVACCGDGWVAEYTRRVATMMRSYLRGGRSYVYWFTLPAPNRNDFARVYRAVNVAIRRAAKEVGRGARIVDLVPVFTPGGQFRQYVTFRGKRVNARQPDGVHLSIAGASIAATLLIDQLQADHALPRLR